MRQFGGGQSGIGTGWWAGWHWNRFVMDKGYWDRFVVDTGSETGWWWVEWHWNRMVVGRVTKEQVWDGTGAQGQVCSE